LSNRIRKRLASLSVIKLSLTIEPDRIAPGILQVCRDPRSCGGRVSPGCSSALATGDRQTQESLGDFAD
jgi:hypothetical protein